MNELRASVVGATSTTAAASAAAAAAAADAADAAAAAAREQAEHRFEELELRDAAVIAALRQSVADKDHENALLLGKQEALESQLLTIASTPPPPVGPARYCLPPDPPYFEPSFLELDGILRGEQYLAGPSRRW